jgi:hypothetical protein
MVNWREDVEFIYVLAILVSAIVVFFYMYDFAGLPTSAGVAIGVVVVLALIGAAAFETDRAIATWEKLFKEEKKQ